MPPGPRPANAFDPGAKFHIADSTPYTRYFLADIYQFQFYRAACRQAGWTGPLNRCSIYGNKEVGAKFNSHAGDGPVEALAGSAGGLHRRARHRRHRDHRLFRAAVGLADQQNAGRVCTR